MRFHLGGGVPPSTPPLSSEIETDDDLPPLVPIEEADLPQVRAQNTDEIRQHHMKEGKHFKTAKTVEK